jgi:hypothetical protein
MFDVVASGRAVTLDYEKDKKEGRELKARGYRQKDFPCVCASLLGHSLVIRLARSQPHFIYACSPLPHLCFLLLSPSSPCRVFASLFQQVTHQHGMSNTDERVQFVTLDRTIISRPRPPRNRAT